MAYGYGTRSWMHSPEYSQMKQERAKATERYLEKPLGPPIEIPILCTCMSWRYPHELAAHRKLRGDGDWCTPEEREAREQNWREYDTSLR